MGSGPRAKSELPFFVVLLAWRERERGEWMKI